MAHAAEARRILRRLEFHYTPKHASWLNMGEIEIDVPRSQCLDRRIESRDSPLPRPALGKTCDALVPVTLYACRYRKTAALFCATCVRAMRLR